MKKLALLGFLLISDITGGFSQSIIYDLVSNSPEYKDPVFPIDESFKKCDSTWITNLEWGACLGEHISLWKSYVKQTYDTLIELLDTTGQRLMKKSQDSWQKSFDSENELAFYIIMLPSAGFGREDYFKRSYSALYEARNRALELKSCLAIIRNAKEEERTRK